MMMYFYHILRIVSSPVHRAEESMEIILGINAYHGDASACLVVDGS